VVVWHLGCCDSDGKARCFSAGIVSMYKNLHPISYDCPAVQMGTGCILVKAAWRWKSTLSMEEYNHIAELSQTTQKVRPLWLIYNIPS